jgi:hypothetical protein
VRHGHIQLAMCKYRLGQKNADHLQCLPLRLIDGHGKCRAHRELATAQSERHLFCVWRCDAWPWNEHSLAFCKTYCHLCFNDMLHELNDNEPGTISHVTGHVA